MALAPASIRHTLVRDAAPPLKLALLADRPPTTTEAMEPPRPPIFGDGSNPNKIVHTRSSPVASISNGKHGETRDPADLINPSGEPNRNPPTKPNRGPTSGTVAARPDQPDRTSAVVCRISPG